MKYNCLRIHPYAKMFVVGLLLYLGETVFFKCSEKGTFTVKVQTLKGTTIEVHNCKETDRISDFMKKFEKAFDATSTNEAIKDISYNLIHNAKPLVMASMPRNNETLAAFGIDKNSILHFTRLPRPSTIPVNLDDLPVDENEELLNFNKKNIKGKRRNSSDGLIFKNSTTFHQKYIPLDLWNNKEHSASGWYYEDGYLTNSKNKNISRIFENLLPNYNVETKDKEGSSTSTCPLRRCCRICGC